MTLHTLSTSYFLVTLTALKPSLWSYFTFSFLQNLSRRSLNESTEGASITWSGRVFQIATILWLKLYFLILVLQRSWYSASEFLPGLPVISIVIFIAGQICFSGNPLTLVMAGSRRVQWRRGGPRDPPPHNFAQNQFFCPKFGMLIPQGISNYVKFVSYNYLTYPAQGGLRNMPSRNCILLNLSKSYFKSSVFP